MPDRELERELRELGSMISYPPTPDVAHAARGLLDEDQEDRTRRFRLSIEAPMAIAPPATRTSRSRPALPVIVKLGR